MHPALSDSLNADFEDHAEHEYISLVIEHPEFEALSWTNVFESDYGSHESPANLLRLIELDEHHKKEERLTRVPKARLA